MKANLYHNKTAQWAIYVVFFAALLSYPLFVDDPFTMNQFARYAVFAMLAVSVSVVWGFGGILSLGQGIPFGLAAYFMAATMQMQYQDPEYDPIPSFMLTNELTELPVVWEPFWNTTVGLLIALILPTVFMLIFGSMMFRARLRGAFVAIMTLAMLNAWYSMAQDMQPFTAGFNGISPPSPLEVFGVSVDPYSSMLYWVNFGLLAIMAMGAKLLLDSKFGTIVQASRDDPERVRFLGYSVSFYQTVLFTIAALIAAIAGMVWVMTVQYVSPTSLETPLSIYMVIWAAVGGRHSLFGAMIGAILLNALQSYAGDELLTTWLIILGGIFILVVRFLPRGLAGLFEQIIGLIPYRRWSGAKLTSTATAK